MEQMIPLTIDGVHVEVPAGTTVLEAARIAKVNIPTLCYLKDINETANCRLCVVDCGGRALQAAVAALAGERAAERLLDVLGLVLPVALMGLGVVLFARGMGLALGVFGAWLALLQPGMTCQGGKHDVKYSYYHM